MKNFLKSVIFLLIVYFSGQAVNTCAAPRNQASNSNAKHPAPVLALIAKTKQSMRLIKGGTFEMGDWGNEEGLPYDMEKDSRPLHKVTLDTFSMMAYKVSYEDFDVFTDATGNERINMDKIIGLPHRAPKRPAGVSWHGARAYCQWLGKLTNLPFDLPTEAQWEYAARSGGKKVLYATDNGEINRGRNYPPAREWDQPKMPIPDVGSYPPNPAGLHGMSEITREWVKDWYAEDYYRHSPLRNPQGPAQGKKKVQRGNFGTLAETSALVFMRSKAEPVQLRPALDESGNMIEIRYSGFSSLRSDNFRCVVNSKNSLN